MNEKAKDFSAQSTEKKSNHKQDIKIISLLEISQHFSKKNKNIKPLLGLKRKSFKKIKNKENKKSKSKNKLSINKQEQFAINKIINNNNNETCIICFEKINFQDRHFLHCGHCYHCNCINTWIDLGKYECPICKQDIDCDKAFDNSISLEEDNEDEYDDEYDFYIDFNQNNHRNRENGIIINTWNKKEIILFLIMYICLLFLYLLIKVTQNGEIILF